MPAANMMESLQPPALQVPEPRGAPEGSPIWSSSSTPTLRRRRFKMRRMKNVQEPSLEAGLSRDLPGVLAPGKEFLQLPSIEITPSSDEDTPWSNCSTPSASPRRKRFLLRKWLRTVSAQRPEAAVLLRVVSIQGDRFGIISFDFFALSLNFFGLNLSLDFFGLLIPGLKGKEVDEIIF
ncbi:hypothetical protein Cadr_000028836 [Camelus dromedarius]|uniref:GRAM domain-containing protein 1B n=1 Tax=Camelus dromedarius TaxID=9838 RepID=A0A5N4C7L7_CAMDR|nr:hypothetical protein Cadr_000028836 [Camelus dromedarius]